MRGPAIIAIALALAAGTAVADPALDHVVTAPTAWLPGDGVVVGSAAVDHRGGGSLVLGYGLGGLAEVELGGDTDVRACTAPPCDAEQRADPLRQGRATFRIGAHEDAWFRGQPALVFGVTETLPGTRRVGEAYVVASRVLGPARVHAGVAVMDGEQAGVAMGAVVRPLAGLELVPPQYPRTTILGDLEWLPQLEAPRPAAKWLLGYGVRYQALSWGSIELVVRVRQGEGVGGSTVMVRVNGVWRP